MAISPILIYFNGKLTGAPKNQKKDNIMPPEGHRCEISFLISGNLADLFIENIPRMTIEELKRSMKLAEESEHYESAILYRDELKSRQK